MTIKVGWKKDFIEKNTPVMPISGWMGDNLLKKSDKMPWWKGQDIEVGSEVVHVHTSSLDVCMCMRVWVRVCPRSCVRACVRG